MCGFCRLPPFPAGRSGTALARSRWRWTPMPSRLVLPGGGARSRRCSLISPCWRGAGIFTRTKACSARASGPTRQLVSADRLKRLHAALREVLLESIDACGSSHPGLPYGAGRRRGFSERLPGVRPFRQRPALSVGPRWKAAASRGGPPFFARTVSWPDIRSYNPFTRPQGLKNAEDDLPVAG